MHTESLNYSCHDQQFIAHVAYDNSFSESRPCVLVVHAFEGRNQMACEYAEYWAQQGYVGIALDMYGNAEVAEDFEGCVARCMALINDRQTLQDRILAGFNAAKTLSVVNPEKIVAMGFCFGGLTVLDLARSGADIAGVVSIHGVFVPPTDLPKQTITAKVLALHGYADPQTSTEQIQGFYQEMTEAKADWQFHFFGDAKHAFTDPDAEQLGPPEMGRKYNAKAAERSRHYCAQFFTELFAE